jgi:hypothetical protein
MTQDEEVVVEPTEPVELSEPNEPKEPTEPEEPQEDYRGKLNATNNFLKKEGYTFDETKKLWVKPTPASTPPKKSNALSDDDNARITRSEDRSERAALRSLGITHTEDIQYVRDAAKRLGIDVEEAATDEFVQSKLERMQAVRKTNAATPPSSKRGGSSRNAKLPDFSKMSNADFDKWEKENRN